MIARNNILKTITKRTLNWLLFWNRELSSKFGIVNTTSTFQTLCGLLNFEAVHGQSEERT